jgi:hypothetical protein
MVTRWHTVVSLFTHPRVAYAFCAILVIAIGATHAHRGLDRVDDAVQHARTIGAELIVKWPGDVAVRDVPKAFDLRTGRFFGDPHYAGEVGWYPFMTPLIAALASATTGARVNEAYLATGVVMGALFIVALGAFLATSAGTPLAVLVLPVAMLLRVASVDDDVYPFQTARAALVLYLALAGAAMARDSAAEGRRRARYAYAGAGALNGILALWHGASFVVASAVSAALLAHLAVRFARHPGTRREMLVRTGLLAVPMLSIASVMFLPQLLRYGAIVQSDAARLWLETYYNGGNDPGALLALRLLPRGWDALWLAAFGAVLVLSGNRRRRAAPLAVAFVVAKGLAHAGFVVNDAEHPWLATMAAKLLVVPPHTLNDAGELVFVLMKLWVAAVAADAAVDLARRRLRRQPGEPAPPRDRSGAANALACAAAILMTGLAFRIPQQDHVFAQAVSREWLLFAEQTAREIGPDATVVGAEPFIALAHFKLLWLPFSAHANPYVAAERKEAAASLLRSAEMGDRRSVGETLRKYNVQYAIGDTALTRTCGDTVVGRAPDGVPVVRLRPGCRE